MSFVWFVLWAGVFGVEAGALTRQTRQLMNAERQWVSLMFESGQFLRGLILAKTNWLAVHWKVECLKPCRAVLQILLVSDYGGNSHNRKHKRVTRSRTSAPNSAGTVSGVWG